ncbi:hypothetical protein QQF64_024502 [Cirrhinus molitorella]|uniref:Uncharacterized protein n=1 Tax=Cirrhinus molitorella TaxID=172907 RepID=A0ABR3NLE1_9TELE
MTNPTNETHYQLQRSSRLKGSVYLKRIITGFQKSPQSLYSPVQNCAVMFRNSLKMLLGGKSNRKNRNSGSFRQTSGKSDSPNRPAIHLSEMCIKGTSHFPERPPVFSPCPQTVVEIHASLVTSEVIFSSGPLAPL